MRGSVLRGSNGGDRAGAALGFVLLLMLALIGLGHSLLVVALAELAGSHAGVRELRARAAAEGALAAALRLSPDAWIDSISIGEVRSTDTLRLGGTWSVAVLRRLSRESWLVEGRGRLSGGAEARAARLTWALDPLARVVALGGVLNGSAEAAWTVFGSVDAGAPMRVEEPLDSADCGPWLLTLASRYAGAPLARTAPLVDTVGGPGLGRLAFAPLLAATPIGVSGVGTPAPVEAAGSCLLDAPWGWGDPDDAVAPCGSHLALRGSDGDLTMVGGAGQGVLVVAGDLTLTAGARYFGMVVVSGRLLVEDGASLEGMVLALDGGEVSVGAEVRGSACWAVRALAAQRDAIGGFRVLEVLGPLGAL